jgi:prepilin-type N-terminal cleavage/methylation domain-containing protein
MGHQPRDSHRGSPLVSLKASRSFRARRGARILNHALSYCPYNADMEKEPAIQGFTLMEMAIVLVIVGLLVGGVLAGSNLIRAAQIRRIGTEEQRIVTTVRVFKTIYSALPGDMPNATSIWGTLNPNPALCKNMVSTDAKTCNGDGNGRILQIVGSWEEFRFWQHLANAGLWEGRYTGVYGPRQEPGKNIPTAPMDGAGWMVWNLLTQTGEASGNVWFDGYYGNVLMCVQVETNPGLSTTYQPLTPEEALNFDFKYDDGKPGRGFIRVNTPAMFLQCADSNIGATAAYKTSVEDKTCNPIFVNVF